MSYITTEIPHCPHTDCSQWGPGTKVDGCDDCCDGRDIGAVCAYASTCDHCGELTSHVEMVTDEVTVLGYCAECVKIMGHTIQKICSICQTIVPYTETIEEPDTYAVYCTSCAKGQGIIE